MLRFLILLHLVAFILICPEVYGERVNPFADDKTQEEFETDQKPRKKALSKKGLAKLKKVLKVIGVKYSSKYSNGKLIKAVEKQKVKLSTMTFQSKSISRFRGAHQYEEGLGGYSFYAKKKENFGTKTQLGYFKKKVDDKYLFVYGIQKRGFKAKNIRVNSYTYRMYLYQCREKPYSWNRLSNSIKAQVDSSRARKEFDQKKKYKLSLCDKALKLLAVK